MQIFSWPAPPEPRVQPPEIPSEYTSFGMRYRVVNGIPVPEPSAFASPDKDRLRGLINQSLSTFADLVTYPEDREELLERIHAIHADINSLLNNAKRIEAAQELERLRNNHIACRNRVADEIRRRISTFRP